VPLSQLPPTTLPTRVLKKRAAQKVRKWWDQRPGRLHFSVSLLGGGEVPDSAVSHCWRLVRSAIEQDGMCSAFCVKIGEPRSTPSTSPTQKTKCCQRNIRESREVWNHWQTRSYLHAFNLFGDFKYPEIRSHNAQIKMLYALEDADDSWAGSSRNRKLHVAAFNFELRGAGQTHQHTDTPHTHTPAGARVASCPERPCHRL